MRASIAAALLLALGAGSAAAEPDSAPDHEADGVPVMTMDGRCAPLAQALAAVTAAGLVPVVQGATLNGRFRLVIAASPDLSNWRLLIIDGALGLACLMRRGTGLELSPMLRDEGEPS